VELRIVASDLGECGLERLPVLGTERLDTPVLLGLEGPDFPFAFHDEPERHGLDPPGRETGLDALPEDRAGLVAHQPVQDPARLLRVDLPVVDLSWIAQGLLYGGLGDLVKQDAVDRR
jgi:hypothetical protein